MVFCYSMPSKLTVEAGLAVWYSLLNFLVITMLELCKRIRLSLHI